MAEGGILGECSLCSSQHLSFVCFSWWNLFTYRALTLSFCLDTLCLPSDLRFNNLNGSVPLELLEKKNFLELLNKSTYQPLFIYGNKFSDLISIEGSVICNGESGVEKTPGYERKGEHYCDCGYDCLPPPPEWYANNACDCKEAQACCESFFSQYKECIICEFSLGNPHFYIHEYSTSCEILEYNTHLDRQAYSSEKMCNDRRTDLISRGCRCNKEGVVRDLTGVTEETMTN